MTQCKTCDRREATQDEWLDIAPGERPDLCFGEGDCTDRAVDWRARALTLSAALDEARRERDEARALKVPPTVEALLAAQMDAATARAERDALREAAKAYVDTRYGIGTSVQHYVAERSLRALLETGS